MGWINKVIEYGTYLLLFLLPIQTRYIFKSEPINGGYLEYNTISIYVVDIILVFLGFLFLFKFFKEIQKIDCYKIKRYWFVLGILDLIIIISIFFAHNWEIALYKYIIIFFSIMLFGIITIFKHKKIWVVYSLLSGLALHALLGIYQFLSQSSFACKYLGIAKHDSSVLGTSVVEVANGRWLRSYGGFDHPNVLGAALVIGLLFLIITVINNRKNNRLMSFSLILLFIFFLAILFTFSRAAYLGLFIGGIAIVLANLKKIKKIRLNRLNLKLVTILIFMTFILSIDPIALSYSRITGGGRLDSVSNSERIEYIQDAKEIISDNLLIGVGIGNYSNTVSTINPGMESYVYQPVHNVYLLVLSEIGIFGFIAFLLFLILVMRENKKNISNILILLTLLGLMMFDHFWWSLHFGIIFFWLVMGMLLMFRYNRE